MPKCNHKCSNSNSGLILQKIICLYIWIVKFRNPLINASMTSPKHSIAVEKCNHIFLQLYMVLAISPTQYLCVCHGIIDIYIYTHMYICACVANTLFNFLQVTIPHPTEHPLRTPHPTEHPLRTPVVATRHLHTAEAAMEEHHRLTVEHHQVHTMTPPLHHLPVVADTTTPLPPSLLPLQHPPLLLLPLHPPPVLARLPLLSTLVPPLSPVSRSHHPLSLSQHPLSILTHHLLHASKSKNLTATIII